MNAFMKGVAETNANVKFQVAFIGSWFDPPKAKETALAQIDAGADVMYAERFGVSDAAKDKGILAIGNDAVLSHGSAAALHKLSPTSPTTAHVTVPATGGRKKRRGIVVHRSKTLTADAIEMFCGTGYWPDIRRFGEHEMHDGAKSEVHREWSSRFTVPCPPLVLGKAVVKEWLGRDWE